MSADLSIPAIRFRGISKRFPGTVALQDVSFDVLPGACHALMGENGAGKSTLGKILAGIHRPDEGHFEIDGVVRRFRSPLEARRSGVGIIHQELSFCPNLSVAENICLSDLPNRAGRMDWRRLHQKAQACLAEIGAESDVREELGRLSAGQTQMVQIAATLATGARIFVMDEPTSSLSAAESHRLEALIGRLRRRGVTILYVSHRMDEIFRFCDTVTVMRDGQHVATMPLAGTDEAELVRLPSLDQPSQKDSCRQCGSEGQHRPVYDDSLDDFRNVPGQPLLRLAGAISDARATGKGSDVSSIPVPV